MAKASCLTRIWIWNPAQDQAVGLDFPELGKDLHQDDILLLDDGRIVLKVDHVDQDKVHTIVQVGGPLSNNKGINLQGVDYPHLR